jgi:hypothetical protein
MRNIKVYRKLVMTYQPQTFKLGSMSAQKCTADLISITDCLTSL